MKLTFLGTGAGETYPGYWCECPHCTYARKHRGKKPENKQQHGD
mgnify:CR=1 FL=1